MKLTLADLDWLATQEIPAAADLHQLRKLHAPHEAALLYEQCLLRAKAAGALRLDAPMLDREALQQATAWPLAAHRARQLLARAKDGPVLELGCGIGADTLELARAGAHVVAWERDPVRLRMARHNLAGLPVEFQEGDWRDFDLAAFQPGAIFADPTRRDGDRRIFDPEGYDPPLSTLLQLAELAPVCLKVAPGLPDEAIGSWEIEFVSHERSCKEAVLWSPSLRPRRATLIAQGTHELETGQPESLTEPFEGCWLHEPDPAAIRARALGPLCHQLDALPFSREIAYLIGQRSASSVWAQSFRILRIHKVDWKVISRSLQELGFASLEIKKRGFPLEPEEVRRKLKLPKGKGTGVLFLTRDENKHLALLGIRAPVGE